MPSSCHETGLLTELLPLTHPPASARNSNLLYSDWSHFRARNVILQPPCLESQLLLPPFSSKMDCSQIFLPLVNLVVITFAKPCKWNCVVPSTCGSQNRNAKIIQNNKDIKKVAQPLEKQSTVCCKLPQSDCSSALSYYFLRNSGVDVSGFSMNKGSAWFSVV